MIEIIGWIGSTLLAICGFPQAWMSYKQGHSDGVSGGLLWCWALGELFTLLYIISIGNAPLLLNYTCNLISLSVIVYYKIRNRF